MRVTSRSAQNKDSAPDSRDHEKTPPFLSLKIAMIEDDLSDFFILKLLLEEYPSLVERIQRFDDIEDFFKSEDKDYSIIVLDRFLAGSGLSEGKIPDIKAFIPDAAIIMYTGNLTPTLKAVAAQEGAFCVIEKGALSSPEIMMVFQAAAMVAGPSNT